jgi:hypothetical protein
VDAPQEIAGGAGKIKEDVAPPTCGDGGDGDGDGDGGGNDDDHGAVHFGNGGDTPHRLRAL